MDVALRGFPGRERPDPQPYTGGLRVPPQNVEAERSLLGGLLTEDGALLKVLEILEPEFFYKEAHKIIYNAILDLFERNEPQDLVTVHNHLKSKGLISKVGGAAYLAELTDTLPLGPNIVHYARIVRDKAILRKLIEKSAEILNYCFDESGDVDEILEAAETGIFEITQAKIRQNFSPLSSVLVKAVEKVERLYNRKELITGVPTGFIELDKMTAGFQPSDLIIIAGRPSMGKTAFALNIAQHAALHHGVPVAVFSLEMASEQLVLRMLSSEAKVDAHKLRTGFLPEKDWPRITQAAGHLSEAPIFIDETPAITVTEMRAKARRLKMEQGLGLVVVDYLQLMRSRAGAERREQEISEISRSLKAMAKELQVPVVALSQLNRNVEQRPNKRPQMADLRESGAIEQDADLIAFIYRDEVYNRSEDNPNKGMAEIIVAKQRNGPTGTVKLAFVARYSSFENLTQRPEEF